MPPKKEKKGKDEEKQKDTFSEVDRTFLELELAECNRKVARLRTAVDEYEQRNEELQKEYNKLDEDRADIIAYLKKTLNVKNEENTELKEKVIGLEEIREIETKQFLEQIEELKKNFTIMKDQLSSENKLLSGKLNSLEEFRAIRDDLMKKYEQQEQDFKDQELKYKRLIYDAEKKFIIGKDKLKKEMEARLLQLAQDFQDATELRIAASTHRVIRENIAINNELDSVLSTQAKLADQNEKYKESERAAKLALELAEEERDKAIDRNIIHIKVIDKLTKSYDEVKYERALYEQKTFDFEAQQKKIEKLTKENEKLSFQIRVLEQNLHSNMSNKNKVHVEINKSQKECDKLKAILKRASIAIKAALKMEQWATDDPSRELMDRESLLNHLLEIISKHKEAQLADSVDSLATFGAIYEEGDLGFIPKPTKTKVSVSEITSVPSKEKLVVEEEESFKEESTISYGSVRTIPSIDILPIKTDVEINKRVSLPSLIPSTKSSESEPTIEEKSVQDVQRSVFDLVDIKDEITQSKLDMASKVDIVPEKSEESTGEELDSNISGKRSSGEVGPEERNDEEIKLEEDHQDGEKIQSENETATDP